MKVSVIVPFHNAAPFVRECLESTFAQTWRPLEVVIYNDNSSDDSLTIVETWMNDIMTKMSDEEKACFTVKLGGSVVTVPPGTAGRGPGFSRNEAFLMSSGDLIAHLDADDIMMPQRIARQVSLFMSLGCPPLSLIGCNFDRIPADSTPYYTSWINGLTEKQMMLQCYRECTIICPTWMYSRELYFKVASKYCKGTSSEGCTNIELSSILSKRKWSVEDVTGEEDNAVLRKDETLIEKSRAFLEANAASQYGLQRVPEDLFFFLDTIELGGTLAKVDGDPLLTYRYTPGGWALGTHKLDLKRVRIKYLEKMVLSSPPYSNGFSIWGYGKDGRKFFQLLSPVIASKVISFCDVSIKKVGMQYFNKHSKKQMKVLHFSEVVPPLIICVGSNHTNGELEKNISSRGFVEGIDYFHFC